VNSNEDSESASVDTADVSVTGGLLLQDWCGSTC
jgi:hypothetical protein